MTRTLGSLMGLVKLDPNEYKDAIGICTDCGEYTAVLLPCCPRGAVWFEGNTYFVDDFEPELILQFELEYYKH